MFPALSLADEKTEIVNQQLNMVENERSRLVHADESGQKSSRTQLYAEEQSPRVYPKNENTGDTLKEFLSPDLSETPRPRTPSQVKTRVHTLDTGAEIFYYRYQEPDLGVKIWGPMYGYYADYAYRPADPNFFNNFLTNVYFLQARYATSHDFDYKGSGIEKGEHDEAMEFRGLIGKDYFVGTDSRVTPYFGFGYRYLFDHGNGRLTNTGAHGYDRKSHYYYLPLGGDVVINAPKDWEIELNAEYDIFIEGIQKSFLSNVNRFTGDNYTDVVNPQSHGFGVRGSIKFLKRGPVVDFYMEPYIRFWNIDASKTETEVVDGVLVYLTEPKNNTTEVGSKFGIQF